MGLRSLALERESVSLVGEAIGQRTYVNIEAIPPKPHIMIMFGNDFRSKQPPPNSLPRFRPARQTQAYPCRTRVTEFRLALLVCSNKLANYQLRILKITTCMNTTIHNRTRNCVLLDNAPKQRKERRKPKGR